MTQERLNALLVELGGRLETVVRLKGGDPFVFGRGGEEALALEAAGIAFEIVPGVSSAHAVPAYAGIPVTQRGVAAQVTFVTGHEDPARPESAIDWTSLAATPGTLVFLMGVGALEENARRLIAHGMRRRHAGRRHLARHAAGPAHGDRAACADRRGRRVARRARRSPWSATSRGCASTWRGSSTGRCTDAGSSSPARGRRRACSAPGSRSWEPPSSRRPPSGSSRSRSTRPTWRASTSSS